MKVQASIITIGDELLIGQVIDTNSAWIAQLLNTAGIAVKHRIAVGDVWDDIWQALDEESKHADIILITGGLGPTADDITKPLLCEYFGGKMIRDEATFKHLTYFFDEVLKRPFTERNQKQAEVPDVCTVLKNEKGTASAMLFEKNNKLFFAMPGVPFEMKWIMEAHVMPLLKQRFDTGVILHRTLITSGIGESFLADRIQDFEIALPSHIKLAYLPNFGMVRLRLTAKGFDKAFLEKDIDTHFVQLQNMLQDVMLFNEDTDLQTALGNLLKQRGETVSTAESCTGGYIAHLLTSLPGSSKYFWGSIVSYDNTIKQNVLNVEENTLQQKGAVSEETVVQMAKRVREIMNTTYSIAVSGIMGPDGGTPEKPVGTVWIAISGPKGVKSLKLHFRHDRERNIQLTANNALLVLYNFILGK